MAYLLSTPDYEPNVPGILTCWMLMSLVLKRRLGQVAVKTPILLN